MKKITTQFFLYVLLALTISIQANAGGLVVNAGIDINACPGDTVMLVATISGVPPYTIAWTPTTGLTDPTNDTTYAVVTNADINYAVSVMDASPAMASDTVLVDSRWITVDAGPDQNVQCGNTISITAFPSGEASTASYEWSNGANGFFISGIAVGGYQVTATNSYGCSYIDEINVYRMPTGQDIAMQMASFICKDSSTRMYNVSALVDSIGPFPITSWTWDFGNGTIVSAFDSADVTYAAAGTYTVKLTMALGSCMISRTQLIEVQDCSVGNDCVPNSALTEPGLDPDQENFPCADRGVYFDEVIQFVNFDTVDAFGSEIIVNWIKVNTIYNLPCGLTWEMDRPDNFYNGKEQGCINIYGTTTDMPGQYPLEIFVDANISGFAPFPVTLSDAPASVFGLGYNIRVKNAGALCWELDTTFTMYDSLTACNGGGDTLSVVATDSSSICPGDSVQLLAKGFGGDGPYTYRWTPATGLSCTFCDDPIAKPNTPTTYTVDVNDVNGFVGSNTVHVDISIFEVDLGADTNLTCGTFFIDLVPSFSGDAAAPLTYMWSTGSSDSIINVEAGSYDVVVTNAYGCSAFDDIVVTVDSALSFDAGDDAIICDSATQTIPLMPAIITNGSGNYVYSWTPTAGLDNPAIFGPVATINDDVTYTLSISDMSNGCSFTDDVSFEFFYLIVDAGDDIEFDGTGTQTMNPTVDTIRSSPIQLKYTWSPTTGLSDHTIKNPVINPIATTEYILTVSNLTNDCSFSDTVTVMLPDGIENMPLNAFVNVFPNPSTGIFTLELNEIIGSTGSIEVYNLQGQVVFSSDLNASSQTFALDLSKASKGVYFLNIETPIGKAMKRITIQ